MYVNIEQLENNDTLTSTLRITKTQTIRFIRLRLFKYDSPNGTLTLTLKDGATQIASQTLIMTDLIADTPSTYAHGWFRFDMGVNGLRINIDPTTTYKELNLEINLSGHTDDANNYLGICKNFGSQQFITTHGTITNKDDMSDEQLTHFSPYALEIYIIK